MRPILPEYRADTIEEEGNIGRTPLEPQTSKLNQGQVIRHCSKSVVSH